MEASSREGHAFRTSSAFRPAPRTRFPHLGAGDALAPDHRAPCGQPRIRERRNLLKGLDIGFDYIFKTVPEQHIRFDWAAFNAQETRFLTGAMNCADGRTVWFEKEEIEPPFSGDRRPRAQCRCSRRCSTSRDTICSTAARQTRSRSEIRRGRQPLSRRRPDAQRRHKGSRSGTAGLFEGRVPSTPRWRRRAPPPRINRQLALRAG